MILPANNNGRMKQAHGAKDNGRYEVRTSRLLLKGRPYISKTNMSQPHARARAHAHESQFTCDKLLGPLSFSILNY